MTRPNNHGVRERLSEEWRKKALCLARSQNDPALMKIWVDQNSEFHFIAEEVCDVCPVREACIMDALKDPRSEGIRGGVYFYSGKVDAEGQKKIREKFPDIPPHMISKKYAERARVEADEDL